MMTDIAVPLSNRIPTARPQEPADTDRSSQQNTETGKTADRQPVNATERQGCEQADQDTASNSNSKTPTRRESFEETLQKRIEKSDSKEEKNETEQTDPADVTQAVVAAVIFQPQSKTPITIQALGSEQGMSQKQNRNPALQTGTSVSSDLTRMPHTAENKTTSAVTTEPINQQAQNLQSNQKQNVAERPGLQLKTDTLSTEGLKAAVQKAAGEYAVSAQKATDSVPVNTESTIPESTAEGKLSLQINNKDSELSISDKVLQTLLQKNTSEKTETSDTLIKKLPVSSSKKGTSETTTETNGEQSSIPTKVSSGLDAIDSIQTSPDVTARMSRSAAITATAQTNAVTTNAVTTTAQPETVKGLTEIAAPNSVDQIVQTLQLRTFGADSQVRMMLAPEELGAIRITFRQTDGEIVGLLEAQKPETRKELEQSVGQLAAAMETAGVQVRRIEVVPWSANNQSSRSDQSGQEFDAATHQEMHRFYGEGTSQGNTRNGLAGESDAVPAAAQKSAYDNFNDSQTGLNFFI